MTANRHLHFVFDIVKDKNIYQDRQSSCPFCNRQALEDILDEAGSILLIKNKFPTVANAYQTVIIETDDCYADMSTYTSEHMEKVIAFGIDHWLEMEKTGDFKSVILYKNHGPLSGGSIDHAHMQIVGLTDIDYTLNLRDDIFEGIEIHSDGINSLNISTKPNACALEFNVITVPRNDRFMADAIQNVVRYVLKQNNSFNLFFYLWRGAIICKIVPRYVTSPFLVGYSIPQTSNRLNRIAEEIKQACYPVTTDPGTK